MNRPPKMWLGAAVNEWTLAAQKLNKMGICKAVFS